MAKADKAMAPNRDGESEEYDMSDDLIEMRYQVIRSTIERNIKSFSTKREHNRNRAFVLRMIIVVVGAATTVVLGFKPYAGFSNADAVLSSVALVLSGIVPIFAAWEAFFDHRWLWLRYTETLGSLYALRDELDYARAGNQLDAEKLDDFFDRTERTLEKQNKEWTTKRKREHTSGTRTSPAQA
jgi:hypothetical protein